MICCVDPDAVTKQSIGAMVLHFTKSDQIQNFR